MSTTIQKQNRNAFTLVELLVVIAIIGILASLVTAAVFGALNAARQGAYKQQANTLNEGVENYRNKYGDYPPDGSSWPIMERHLRKAFPQILQSEMDLLAPVAPGANGGLQIHNHFGGGYPFVMDPAEALVFFLGGFSSDPQRPFTGVGGPFLATSLPAVLQYNTRRSNSFFEFNTNRLSLRQRPNLAPAISETIFVSEDDSRFFNIANDILPVYLSDSGGIERTAPFVYFDSRTYVFLTNPAAPTSTFVNYYQRVLPTGTAADDRYGAIRPLVSKRPRTPVVPVGSRTILQWLKSNEFMNDKTFQIIGPGGDGIYGGRLAQDVNLNELRDRCEALFVYSSGDSFSPVGVGGNSSGLIYSGWKLNQSVVTAPQYARSLGGEDNTANFSGTTFATSTDD